ncbi:MAG: pseudouridine synthase [bacterium]
MIRLNKYLSECGIASRRKSEEYIKDGRVSVNGKTVVELSTTVDPFKDIIELDSEKLKLKQKVYFILNKPKGFISTTKDEKDRKTVIDLINTKEKIFPVGRLDHDTTGVLILTNDGEFSNYLTHPSHKIAREYYAVLDKPLTEEDRKKLITGIYLERRKSKFTKILFPKKDFYKGVIVVTEEGRNHFVKNMFFALGYEVMHLHRNSFGGITVGNLNVGNYRKVSLSELNKILKKNVK